MLTKNNACYDTDNVHLDLSRDFGRFTINTEIIKLFHAKRFLVNILVYITIKKKKKKYL